MDPCMPPPPGVDRQAPDPNAQYSMDGDVPEEFLHPCCQKDLQEKRVRDRVLTKVRAADRAAQALARRKGAVVGVGKDAAGLAEWARHRHEHGSGCCELMADYPALAFLRMGRDLLPSASRPEDDEEDEQPLTSRRGGGRASSDDDDEDEEEEEEEDSDDEFLRELEGEGAGGFMEVRMAEMMRKAEEAVELRYLGVGLHTELAPARILNLVHLRCPALVAHLYHPHSPLSATLDLLLEHLAAQYPGTRFVRASLPEAQAAGMDQRLRVPPAALAAAEAAGVGDGGKSGLLLAVRDGCLVDACGDYGRRFGDRGGGSGGAMVYEDALEQWLRHGHVLVSEAPDLTKARRLLGALERRAQQVQEAGDRWEDAGGRRARLRRGGAGDSGSDDDDEGEEESYYDCGLAGCRKTFSHSHVGLQEEGVDLPREFGSGAGPVV